MRKIIFLLLFMLLFPLIITSQQMMMSSDPIMPYSNLEEARMQAEKGPVVLFFHAGWCPYCKRAMNDLESRRSDLGNITVMVVNYDDSKMEKRKYGVTYQHTFVQIDSRGRALTKWNGGGVDELLENVIREEMN